MVASEVHEIDEIKEYLDLDRYVVVDSINVLKM